MGRKALELSSHHYLERHPSITAVANHHCHLREAANAALQNAFVLKLVLTSEEYDLLLN